MPELRWPRGRVFFFDRQDGQARLRALEPRTGRELWSSGYEYEYEDHFGYSDGPRATPTFVPGRGGAHDDAGSDLVVTFGVEGQLSAYQASDGQTRVAHRHGPGLRCDPKTSSASGRTPWLEPAAGDQPERLIVMVGGSPEDSPELFSGKTQPDNSALVAFDPRTGQQLWRSGSHLASYSSPGGCRGGRRSSRICVPA